MKKIILLIIIFILSITTIFRFSLFNHGNNEVNIKSDSVITIPRKFTKIEYDNFEDNIDLSYYSENKEINNDYIGDLKIDGLINQKVVHTTDNEFYLNHNFEKEYFSQGSVFMDYRNTLEDQNIILYGHYVYKDETAMFSPLHLLKDINNYEEYKYIFLNLGEEVRKYKISKVYYYIMGSQNLIFYETNYSESEFENYMKYVDKAVFYDTGVQMSNDDSFITLQTCVRNRDDLRLIIIGKRIEE
ncbi:MAG: class B sortase [Erysipelotrichaceae bacterium]|nr:class B sortase [Erysipelotrichaceae bacterium]